MAELGFKYFLTSCWCQCCRKKRAFQPGCVCPDCGGRMEPDGSERVLVVDYHNELDTKIGFDLVIRRAEKAGCRFAVFVHGYGKDSGIARTKHSLHSHFRDNLWSTRGGDRDNNRRSVILSRHFIWVAGEDMRNTHPWNEITELYRTYQGNRGVTLCCFVGGTEKS